MHTSGQLLDFLLIFTEIIADSSQTRETVVIVSVISLNHRDETLFNRIGLLLQKLSLPLLIYNSHHDTQKSTLPCLRIGNHIHHVVQSTDQFIYR